MAVIFLTFTASSLSILPPSGWRNERNPHTWQDKPIPANEERNYGPRINPGWWLEGVMHRMAGNEGNVSQARFGKDKNNLECPFFAFSPGVSQPVSCDNVSFVVR